jgi:hypothetical protein
MKNNKLAALKQELETRTEPTVPGPVKEILRARSSYKAPSREGRCHIAAVLPSAYKTSIRAVQMQHDKPLQHLVAEALNLLFEKYNVATVAE